MSYRLRATAEFWSDFSAAAEYIARELKNPAAAERLLTELEKQAETLTEFPKAVMPWASPPETDTDYYALRVRNYLAFYVVLDDVVELRRFLYGRADLRVRVP